MGSGLGDYPTLSDPWDWYVRLQISWYIYIYMSIYGLVNAGKYYNKSGTNFSQGHPQIGWFSQAIPPNMPWIIVVWLRLGCDIGGAKELGS